MSEYAQRFAEDRIDFSVLRDLTDQDLKDLGVVLGDRRKILRAIADQNEAEKVTSKPAAVTPVAPHDTAERRQVTVMFSDLVGSTALSARMDPEDLREVISAYQKCVAESVRRYGGFVAKFMGDGVLIYFGYPQAHVEPQHFPGYNQLWLESPAPRTRKPSNAKLHYWSQRSVPRSSPMKSTPRSTLKES